MRCEKIYRTRQVADDNIIRHMRRHPHTERHTEYVIIIAFSTATLIIRTLPTLYESSDK